MWPRDTSHDLPKRDGDKSNLKVNSSGQKVKFKVKKLWSTQTRKKSEEGVVIRGRDRSQIEAFQDTLFEL